MHRARPSIALIILLGLSVSGCAVLGNEPDANETTIGDAAAGEALYMQPLVGPMNAPGCLTCHSLEPGVVIAGPSLAGIGAAAGSRVPGQATEVYLRDSIISPDNFILDGYESGDMYSSYGEELSEVQVNDLVEFLLSLN
jgi:hypothetical protein